MRNILISTHDECHAAVYHFVEVANKVQKELVFSRRLLTEEQRGRFSTKRLHASEAYNAATQLKKEFGLEKDDLFLVVVDSNVFDDEDDEYFFVAADDRLPPNDARSGVGIISLFFLNSQSTFMKEGGA